MRLIAPATLFPCCLLPGQSDDWSVGPVLAIAQAMSVDAATAIAGANAGSLLFSRSDFKSLPPAPWAPNPAFPALPDFGTLPWLPLPAVDLDAISIGLDYILSTPTGVIAVPSGSWGAITFSVSRATTGVPAGLISAQVAGPGGAAGDVFGYILPGSTGFPASWIDRPLRTQDSKEISVDATGSPGNVDALDLYLGLLFLENPQVAAMVPGFPAVSVYFSVTAASLPSVPTAWWSGNPASGAVILQTTWTPASSSWTLPVPFLLPAALGITSAEDVDALALDLLRGRVLFSTTRLPPPLDRDPVLFVNLGAPGTNYVYRRADNVPVSARVGLAPGGIDDIDGICALDPGVGSQPRLDFLIGTPQNPLLPTAPGRLGSAVYRRLNQNGSTQELVSYMTGFPPPGPPLPGIAIAAVTLGAPTNPYVTVASYLRPNPASPYFGFDGHPERCVVPVPNNPVLLGVPAFFVWAVFDGVAFDLSLPTGITL